MSCQNKITLGIDGSLGEVYKLKRIDIDQISYLIAKRVNDVLGYTVISGVGDDLITKIFQTVRTKSRGINVDDILYLLDMLKKETVDIISSDAISHYNKKKINKTRTVWTRVDRVHSENVNGQGMIDQNGVSGSPLNRFTYDKAHLTNDDISIESYHPSVWTSVDRVHSQNVNGQGMIDRNGVSGSQVALRF
jgi:hypothetical protein